MMDQEYTPEDDPDSFLGPGWEEEALGAEAFQEPPESPANRTVDNRYMVPLIPQEQAYANHESQMNQAPVPNGGSDTIGETRWGLRGRGQEQGPSPSHAEQGSVRR